MGMFDTVHCHFPLPTTPSKEPAASKTDFQTRDMPIPNLDIYEIRADGSLYVKRAAVEHREFEPCFYHGELEFYTDGDYKVDSEKVGSWWLEYVAVFKNGKVDHIRTIRDSRRTTTFDAEHITRTLPPPSIDASRKPDE